MLEHTQLKANRAGTRTGCRDEKSSSLHAAWHALERERQRLLGKIRREQARLVEQDRAIGNDPADSADQLRRQSKHIAMQHLWERMLQEVERAMARIESATYGFCKHCGRLIPSERLCALPSAVLCTDCAARQAENVWAV